MTQMLDLENKCLKAAIITIITTNRDRWKYAHYIIYNIYAQNLTRKNRNYK